MSLYGSDVNAPTRPTTDDGYARGTMAQPAAAVTKSRRSFPTKDPRFRNKSKQALNFNTTRAALCMPAPTMARAPKDAPAITGPETLF